MLCPPSQPVTVIAVTGVHVRDTATAQVAVYRRPVRAAKVTAVLIIERCRTVLTERWRYITKKRESLTPASSRTRHNIPAPLYLSDNITRTSQMTCTSRNTAQFSRAPWRGRRKVCGDFGAQLREFNGQDDHVYLLVEYPPKVAIAGLVNSLKGGPARWLRSEFTGRVSRHIRHGHLWSPSHFAASRRGAPAEHHPPVHPNSKGARLPQLPD